MNICSPVDRFTNVAKDKSRDFMDQKILDAIDKIYSDMGNLDRWEGIIGAVCKAVDADAGSLSAPWFLPDTDNEDNHQTGTYMAAYGYDLDDPHVKKYRDYYYTIDPLAHELVRQRKFHSGFIGTLHDFLDDDEYQASEFHRDWLSKLGAPTTMFACISGTDDQTTPIAYMSLFRLNGREHFDKTNVARLEPLVPHLQRSLELEQSMLRDHSIAQAVDLARGKAKCGVAVVDFDGRIIHTNDLLKTILQNYEGLIHRNGRIRARDSGIDARLQKAVKVAAVPDQIEKLDSLSPCMVTAPHEDTAIIVRISPFPEGSNESSWPKGAKRPRAVLQFYVNDKQMPVDLGPNITAAFNLTPAEARFAEAFVEHTSVTIAGKQCNITEGTARNVLKSLYRKTGTASQASLIKMILQYA